MKKTVAILLSTAALAIGALAQTPSPAPAPEPQNAPQPPPRERMQRTPGGDREQRGGRPGGMVGMGMENREFGIERMLGAIAMNPEFGKRLNITPEQQASLKKLMESQRAKLMELQAAVTNAANKQTDLMLADPLDEAALMAVVEETGAARTALAKTSIMAVIELRKVLTDEQRKQLRDMVTQMRTRRADQSGQDRGPRMRERMGEKPAAGAPPAPVTAPPPPAPAP